MLTRSRSLRSITGGLFASVVIAATLTGCGPAGSPTPEPTSGGVLNVANNSDAIPSQVLAGRQQNTPWAANVFQTLTALEDGEPQPLLATSWEVADDGLSMTIELRDDVTFHSGRAFTAADVKFSFEQAIDPAFGSQVAPIGSQFSSIDVISDTELEITFATPIPNIFDFFEQTFIIDSETVAGLKDGTQVIGTGPFIWDTWDPGAGYTLLRNDDYWGDAPYLDEIDVAVITDSTALVNAIRSGRTQYAIGLGGIDVAAFQDDPQYELVTSVLSLYPLSVDVTAAPFDNIEVRQAIQYAIDRERIADQVFGGLAIPTTQFFGPDSPGYDADLNSEYAYDPDRATEMIDEAGATGAAFEINVIGIGPNIGVAEIVRNNLEAIGLKPTVTVIEQSDFGPRQNAGDLGPMFMPLHGLLGYGPATLLLVLPAIRDNNPSHFETDEYRDLTADVLSADQDALPEAVTALSEYVVEQAFSLPLVQGTGYIVTDPTLQDERVSARGYADFGRAYIGQ
jgi:peptide/nickel transport system substrate-binding protein